MRRGEVVNLRFLFFGNLGFFLFVFAIGEGMRQGGFVYGMFFLWRLCMGHCCNKNTYIHMQ